MGWIGGVVGTLQSMWSYTLGVGWGGAITFEVDLRPPSPAVAQITLSDFSNVYQVITGIFVDDSWVGTNCVYTTKGAKRVTFVVSTLPGKPAEIYYTSPGRWEYTHEDGYCIALANIFLFYPDPPELYETWIPTPQWDESQGDSY